MAGFESSGDWPSATPVDMADRRLVLMHLAAVGSVIGTTATPSHPSATIETALLAEPTLPQYNKPSFDADREAFPGASEDGYGHEQPLGHVAMGSGVEASHITVLRTGPDCE